MDTLTHVLMGTAVSDSWFRRRLGPIATPFALIASALPDSDVVTYLFAPECAWAYHRGYSHSFFVFLPAAPLLGYLGYRISGKKGGCRQWIALAFICLAAHTLGDLLTSWGTVPLLPFSNARISWDIIPIIDIFMTAVTAASFLLNRILRREETETFLNPIAFPMVHKHPRRVRAANVIAGICVVLVVIYLALGWHQNRQTVNQAQKELIAAGVNPVEVRALPIMFTYLSYGIAARDAAGTIYNAPYSSLAPKPLLFQYYPTATGKAVDSARATQGGKMFAWYSQGMYVAEVEEGEGGSTVRFKDRRFFFLTQSHVSRFIMEFAVDADDRVTGVKCIQTGIDGLNLRAELEAQWNLVRYGEPFRD